MVNPLLSLPGIIHFKIVWEAGRRGLFNEAKIVVSFLHKELEPKKPKKAQAHDVGGHDQPRIKIKSEL